MTSLTESIPTDQSLPLDDSKQTDLNALFERVDELYDGSDEDKENAMRMLQDNEFEVTAEGGSVCYDETAL